MVALAEAVVEGIHVSVAGGRRQSSFWEQLFNILHVEVCRRLYRFLFVS